MKISLRFALALFASGLLVPAGAQTPALIADTPLTSALKLIKPNVVFLLDASGSMAGDRMPDDVPSSGSKYAYRAFQCNGVAYDPSNIYDPPLRSDGTSLPNASFVAAWDDGYDVENLLTTNSNSSITVGIGSKTFNITSTTGFSTAVGQLVQITDRNNRSNFMVGKVTSWVSSSTPKKLTVNVTGTGGGGTSASWMITNLIDLSNQYYYKYTGAQAALNYTYGSTGSLVTTSTFYSECNSNVGSSPGSGVFTKITLTSASSEAQNYANWYAYYRTRMNTMKTAMTRAFGNLSDPQNFRIGFSTIAYSGTAAGDMHYLKVDDYCTAAANCQQRQDFFQRIFRSESTSWTPLRNALSKAGLLYAKKIGPAAEDPVQYYCQKNWAILTTDGYWNTGGGTGDGTNYDDWNDAGGFKLTSTYPTSGSVGSQDASTNTDYVDINNNAVAMARPMLDGANVSNTLADVSMYYYKTDLRDTALGNCTSGSSGKDVCTNQVPLMPDDCNPRQHMNSITIGLGVSGTLNSADYDDGGTPTIGSDWYKLSNGPTNWPNPSSSDSRTIDDLWHAAVNGRGPYYHPRDPREITNSLSKALAKVASSVGGGSAAGVSALQLGSGTNYVYLANYSTGLWDGDLLAYTISATGVLSGSGVSSGTCGSSSASGISWSARNQLQTTAASARTIYTSKGGWGSFDKNNVNLTLTDFDPTKLSQYSALVPAEQAQATRDHLINYLRGEDHELVVTPDYCCENQANNKYRVFRDRDFKLGDIVHSTPYYVGKSPFQYTDPGHGGTTGFKETQTKIKADSGPRDETVFVGANDGMLHAFDANTGAERWAFVPSAVVPNLYKLADFAYNSGHNYFVDGQINVGDVCTKYPSTSCAVGDWRTILVSGLGAGGRDYFALDITDPAHPSLLWEFSSKNAGFVNSLGKSYGTPLIVKIKGGTYDDRWVVVFSNGYDNPDGKTHLFVVDAITGQLVWNPITPSASEVTPEKSGMGSVAGWADHGITDNSVQHVYGGDLNGNLWRFDISTGSAGDATLLAYLTAPGTGSPAPVNGSRQPITTKPELGEVVNGASKNRYVFVGTGKWLGARDVPCSGTATAQQLNCPDSRQQQSLFAIKDDLATSYGQFRGAAGVGTVSITASGTARSVDYTNAASMTNGWIADFPVVSGTAGLLAERVTIDPELQVGWLSVTTSLPTESDDCSAGGSGYHYFFDYNPPARTGSMTSQSWETQWLGNSLSAGAGTVQLADGTTGVIVTNAAGGMQFVPNKAPIGGGTVRRVSWRELVN
jgi:type IV pilus assembly protein PilY1